MAELKHDIYKEIFDTWRYEVDSYWQRNNYFAAFETAALAGCWYVIEQHHLWVGLAFSLLGLASAVIWRLTRPSKTSCASHLLWAGCPHLTPPQNWAPHISTPALGRSLYKARTGRPTVSSLNP